MDLHIENLSFSYGKQDIFSDFSLELGEGIHGLLGPNGAGKTTLIKLIVNNLIPGEGKITWNGTAIDKMGMNYRQLIGYKPQQQSIYPEFTVEEFLHYMGALKGVNKHELPDQMEEVMKHLNLLDQKKKKMKSLSGGMLQRALLCQALIGNPSLLILDEPTAGLDPMERIHMREFIAEISRNKIVLLATHIIEDISTIASDFIFMNHGKILLQGNYEKMKECYENGIKEGRKQSVIMKDEIMVLENLYYDLFR